MLPQALPLSSKCGKSKCALQILLVISVYVKLRFSLSNSDILYQRHYLFTTLFINILLLRTRFYLFSSFTVMTEGFILNELLGL